MNIRWYTNNYVTSDQNVPALCQLIKQFSENYPDSAEKVINLIIDENLLLFDLISKLLEQVNIFGKFNIKVGSYQDPLLIDTSALKGKTIWIGGKGTADSLDRSNTAIISHTSNPKDICLGYQRHFCTNLNPKSVSLGEIKADPLQAEVIIRSLPQIIFDIDSVRKQDSYYKNSKITGLDIYEAAALTRYIGMSLENTFSYYLVDTEELNSETAELVATLIWYQIEGLLHQKIEDNKEEQSYLIHSEYYNAPVEFIKGSKTGRWSFIHPEDKKKYPCTEDDYQSMRDGRIPDSLLTINLTD